jgi:hypothetical protein
MDCKEWPCRWCRGPSRPRRRRSGRLSVITAGTDTSNPRCSAERGGGHPWRARHVRLERGAGVERCPSGTFSANAAWLQCAVLVHNLLRWTQVLGGLRDHDDHCPTVDQTIRTGLVPLPHRRVIRSGTPNPAGTEPPAVAGVVHTRRFGPTRARCRRHLTDRSAVDATAETYYQCADISPTTIANDKSPSPTTSTLQSRPWFSSTNVPRTRRLVGIRSARATRCVELSGAGCRCPEGAGRGPSRAAPRQGRRRTGRSCRPRKQRRCEPGRRPRAARPPSQLAAGGAGR